MKHWCLKLTGKKLSTQRKTYASSTLFKTNSMQNGPGLNPGLHNDGLATDYLSHGRDSKT